MGSSSIPAALLSFVFLTGVVYLSEPAADSLHVTDRPIAADSIATRGGNTPGSNAPGIEHTDIRLGSGELREPLGLAVDARGFVYVADAMTGKVFRYSISGESLEFEKPPDIASLYPIDITVQGMYIYVLDYDENMVLRFDYRGAFIDVLLSFREFDSMHPSSLSADTGGRLATTDIKNHTVTIWTPLLDFEFTLGEYGWTEGKLDRPVKAVFLQDGRVAVAESGNRRIQVFSPAGRFEELLQPPRGEEFRLPRSIATDRMENIFVADIEGGRYLVFSPDGEFYFDIDSFHGNAIKPAAIAIGWNDYIYIADINSRSILVYHLLYPS